MLKSLLKIMGFVEEQPARQDAHYVQGGSSPEDEEIPRYPPFLKGLPMRPPQDLLVTQEELIARIRRTLGLSPQEYEDLIRPLIENCAGFVHLLPASEAHHHRGAGGLFRHSLEVGAYAAQFADGRIFTFGKTPLERKNEEPRWVVAAFCAALLHDIGKVATDMAVVSPDGSIEWVPYLESLWTWGERNQVQRYFVRWRENRHKAHEQSGLLLADQILPSGLKAWLGRHNPEVLRAMLEASTCQGDMPLTQLVKDADEASVSRDQKTNRSTGSDVSVAVPVERHLLDACRRLLGKGTWTINKKGSRVWVTREGVFIVWNKAAEEIVDLLMDDRIPGIPRDKDTLADMLIERDLAKSNEIENPDHPRRYWSVSPAVLDGRNGPLWLQCLKLTEAELIFSTEPPAPARVLLKDADGEPREIDGVGEFAHRDGGEESAQPETEKAASAELPDSKERTESSQEAKEKRRQAPRDRGVKLVPKGEAESSASPAGQAEEAHAPAPSQRQPSSPAPAHEPSPSQVGHEDEASDDQAAAAAQAWLQGYQNEASQFLLKVIEEIGKGFREKEEMFGEEEGVLFLRYPSPVRQYGKPAEIAQHLATLNWIIPDPENSMRKAREMESGKGLVLDTEVAGHLQALLASATRPKTSTQRKADRVAKQSAPSAPPSVAGNKSRKPASAPHKAASAPKPAAEAKSSSRRFDTVEPSEPGRPPKKVRQISSNVEALLKEFAAQVRTGKVPSDERQYAGALHYMVGIGQLQKYASKKTTEFGPHELREALEQRRKDIFIDGHFIMVSSE